MDTMQRGRCKELLINESYTLPEQGQTHCRSSCGNTAFCEYLRVSSEKFAVDVLSYAMTERIPMQSPLPGVDDVEENDRLEF